MKSSFLSTHLSFDELEDRASPALLTLSVSLVILPPPPPPPPPGTTVVVSPLPPAPGPGTTPQANTGGSYA